MNQLLTTTIFLTIFIVPKVFAGWYECYNFKGTIDKYPITLSFQVRQGYFGEAGKKDFNLIGVYKYDKHNDPIRLEGQLNTTDQKVILYELSNNNYSATFLFDFSQNEILGTWKSKTSNKELQLHLNFVSKLVDTLESNQCNGIEILQSKTLPDFYFVGSYSKSSDDDRAKMNKLLIFRKKDNTLFQTIDFSKVETATGNVMTIIYDNIDVENKQSKKISVSNNVGQMGGYLIITYNGTINKFILNPNPKAG